MSGYKCPFCGIALPDVYQTHQTTSSAFCLGSTTTGIPKHDSTSCWSIELWRCPSCLKISTYATGTGSYTSGRTVLIHPESTAKRLPNYIPVTLRADYTEAYSILHKSPKASATLSRRCLQGMIRDFWGITGKKSLYQEIDAIREKVTPSQWSAINGVRKIGNIGAHMEQDINIIVDVEPEEAEKLLSLIELLMDKWYVARHDEEELCRSIVGITEKKEAARHPD